VLDHTAIAVRRDADLIDLDEGVVLSRAPVGVVV
jgi:hypothetical protein